MRPEFEKTPRGRVRRDAGSLPVPKDHRRRRTRLLGAGGGRHTMPWRELQGGGGGTGGGSDGQGVGGAADGREQGMRRRPPAAWRTTESSGNRTLSSALRGACRGWR
jgi:hypothetical protein